MATSLTLKDGRIVTSETTHQHVDECHINRLPREIMVRIFHYFDPVSNSLPLLALVCKKWHKLLYETSALWRRVHVRPPNSDTGHYAILCAIFITYGHNVQHLVWESGTPLYESVFYLLPSLSGLTVLRIPITWDRTVIETLSPLKQLEEVHITGDFDLTDEDLALITIQFPSLRKVTLKSCWSISQDGFTTFANGLTCLEECAIKINTGLPVEDARSDKAMIQGNIIVKNLNLLPRVEVVTSLVLNLVPIEMDELWGAVLSLTQLKKLTVCNCEKLHGVRLNSSSLQKLTMYSLWSANFVSITAPSLRRLRIDYGLESCEHLEVYANKLKTLAVDGNDVLRLVAVRSNRLTTVELRHCPDLSPPDFQNFLKDNPTISSLLLGDISFEETIIEPSWCPRLQSLTIQSDFKSRVISIRCPTLEYLCISEESRITDLETVIVVSNHLKIISLSRVLSLRSLHIQCDLLDSLEVNISNDVRLSLRSCVIHATRMIGTIKLFDCALDALSVVAPSVGVLVLYRCFLQNYTMQMALVGSPFIGHLSLEKCLSLTQFYLPPSVGMRYLNLYGCQRLRLVNIDLPSLSGLNLGQCYKVELRCDGKRIHLNHDIPSNVDFCIMPPRSCIQWKHTEDPISQPNELDDIR